MTKTIVRYRNRPRKRMHHKSGMTLPIAIVAGFVPPMVGVWNRRSSATQVADFLKGAFVGINASGGFDPMLMKNGLFPVMGGFIAHSLASRFGLNRVLGRSGIPFIRI